MFLVLIFTRGWVDPRAVVLSEGNISLKNPVTPPGIDPGTVRLVAQRLNHYATPGPYNIYLCKNLGNPSQRLEFFKSSLRNIKVETCNFSFPLVYFFNPFGVCFVQMTLFCWIAHNCPRSEAADICGSVKLREIMCGCHPTLSKCSLFLQRLPGKVSGMQNEETLSLKLVECKTVFASFGNILWHS